ncbi:MAG: TMEM165/GDT1 family protein, partial [Acidimicrobiales bacterium]
MDPGIALVVFALILVAELPDKTMIAVLIMGSRYRP